MRRAWAWWLGVLGQREDGLGLSLVRIMVGLTVLHDMGATFMHGAIPLIWVDKSSSEMAFRSASEGWLVSLLGGASMEVIFGMVITTALGASFLVVGLFPRSMAFLLLQLCIALYDINLMAGGGHDRVITNALWLLVLADCGRTLSISTWLKTRKWLDETSVPAWPRYLMGLQLVVMYTTTGLQKLGAEWFPWGGYLAVHNMLLTPSWNRYDLSGILGWFEPVTRFSSALTWIWEVSFWVVIFARPKIRYGYVLVGAVFHIGLLLLTDLGPFSLICLSLYPSLFTAEELARVGGLLRKSAQRD